MNILQKAIILNLSDGITTPMSFLLPVVLSHAHQDYKAIIIGSIGAAVSMAFAFKSAEATEGTWGEWLVAFICSALGGILPTLCFVFAPEPFSAVLAGLVILAGIVIISNEKRSQMHFKRALFDTSKNIVPALLTVALLSLL